MNATSRAILQTVLATDPSLSVAERKAAQRLIDGLVSVPEVVRGGEEDDQRLVTQKWAAELLCVSRATIWRMTKDCLLHPVEILPGTWRYPFREIMTLARKGVSGVSGSGEEREDTAAYARYKRWCKGPLSFKAAGFLSVTTGIPCGSCFSTFQRENRRFCSKKIRLKLRLGCLEVP